MILVSLDWVSVSFERTRQISDGAVVRLELQPKGIATFKTAHRVFIDSVFVGVLFSDNNLNERKNLVQFKFDNQYLYCGGGFVAVIDTLRADLGLKYVGLCRVDICGDFIDEKLLSQGFGVVDFCRKVNAGNIKRAALFARSQTRVVMSQVVKEKPVVIIVNGVPETVYFGKTNIRARLYNKTKKLETECKSYINEYWVKNGLDADGDVWRMELEMSGLSSHLKNLYYNGQCLKAFYKWLDDPEFYTNLYFDLIRRNYCFVYSHRNGAAVTSPFFRSESMQKSVNLSHNLYYATRTRPDGIEITNYYKGVRNKLMYLSKLAGDDLTGEQKTAFSDAAGAIDQQFFKIQKRIRDARGSTVTPVSNTGVS